MNTIFLIIFFAVCGFVIWLFNKADIAKAFSFQQRILVQGAILGLLSLFFVPYVFGLITDYKAIPATIFSYPFLLFAGITFVTKLINPRFLDRNIKYYMASFAFIIVLLYMMPLILSVVSL